MGTFLHPLIPASAPTGSGPVANLPVSKLWKQAQNRMISAMAPTPGRVSNQITRGNTNTKEKGEREMVFSFVHFAKLCKKKKK